MTYLSPATALRASSALAVLAVSGAGLALPAAAFAQDATPGSVATRDPAPQEAAEDQIVVTGSRIARPDLSASVPVNVITAAAIQDTGAGNIQDVLAELPAVGQNISRATTNFATTGTGVATVNLRNLGSPRTLVLVDGRRYVAGIPGSSVVDLNTIPTDLIKRTEVVTGGASAVYGSEAIAGVVNFVLDRRFEGAQARGQATVSDEGDAPRQYGSLKLGRAFAEDRGHVVLYGQYDDDHGLRSRDRGFSERDIPNRSSYAAQGLFSPDGSFATGARTFTFDGNNNLKTYQGANIDGYNRNAVRYLSVPVKRYHGTALADFEFAPAVTAYVEGNYTKTKSRASLEAQAIDSFNDLTESDAPGAAPYAGIPITNPFIPAQVRAAMVAADTDRLPFRRRAVEIFDRSNRADRDTWRVVGGLKGAITTWLDYDVNYIHGETKDHTESATVLGPQLRNALNSEVVNGVARCIDAAARAAGCVPINIFGFNTASAAASRYVTNNGQLSTYDAKATQDVAQLNLTGKVLELPGGTLSFATGLEYRREKSSEDFDDATNRGLTLGNVIGDTRGKYNVKEAYLEVVAPILADRPFFHYLGLEGAVRYADYSTVGGVWSWKAGGEYAPIRDIRFRAIYAEATRAPNIGELYGARSETFPAVVDPCDQNGGNGDEVGALRGLPAACRAIPAIAAAAAGGGFTYTTAQIQTINGFVGGNANLTEETARTLTLGTVFTPQFAKNFSLTVDYYRIQVKNAVGIIGQQTSLDECVTGSGDALFCNNIVRNAAGIVTTVNALNLNTGAFLVSGIDTQARLSLPIASGKLDLSAFWNHLLKQQQTSFPGGPTQDELRQLDCYSCGRLGTGFRDKISGSATLSFDRVSLNYRLQYMSSAFDNLASETPIRVKPYTYHDAQLRFNVDDKGKLEFYAGMNNIFDKKPPVFNDTNQVTWPGAQTVASTYDLYGRMFYAGFDVKF